MSFSSLHKVLVLIGSCVLFIGCGGTGPAKSSLDSMSEEERSKVMQKTITDTTEKNMEAMKRQGMMEGKTPPPGVDPNSGGFQPPESMKKYMKGQGGGTGGTGTSTPPSSGDSEQKK